MSTTALKGQTGAGAWSRTRVNTLNGSHRTEVSKQRSLHRNAPRESERRPERTRLTRMTTGEMAATVVASVSESLTDTIVEGALDAFCGLHTIVDNAEILPACMSRAPSPTPRRSPFFEMHKYIQIVDMASAARLFYALPFPHRPPSSSPAPLAKVARRRMRVQELTAWHATSMTGEGVGARACDGCRKGRDRLLR